VKERLFLRGIALNCANIAGWDHQSPAVVISNTAYSIEARQDNASMAAGVAAYLIVREVVVKLALTGVVLENALERSLGVHGKASPINGLYLKLYHV